MSGSQAGSSGNGRPSREDFEKLSFEHLDALYRAALRMTRDQADAEDLVQEAYLRAYRGFHRFEERRSFKAWIFTILRNTFVNEYRKKRREPRLVGLGEVEAGRHPSVNDGVYQADALTNRLHAALDRLPEESRTILLRVYAEGFTYRETAQIMNWPIGTVMSKLFRARKRLRRDLEPYAGYSVSESTGERTVAAETG